MMSALGGWLISKLRRFRVSQVRYDWSLYKRVSVRIWGCVGKLGRAELRKLLLNLDSHLCLCGAIQNLRRDERGDGLRRLRQQRQRQTAPVAHRAGGLRQISWPGVGERREDHLQDTVEARRQTGLQPGRGCRAFQGNPRPREWSSRGWHGTLGALQTYGEMVLQHKDTSFTE